LAAKLVTRFKQRIAGLRLIPSGGGCFEITVNGRLIYSKLETRQFPDEDRIVSEIERLANPG
jgi:selenoprotein W-related protein